jgi:hypothetical protein
MRRCVLQRLRFFPVRFLVFQLPRLVRTVYFRRPLLLARIVLGGP